MPNPDASIVEVDDEPDEQELPPALPVGFVIGGKYQVKRVLGIGGNGAVYEGEHADIGHRVAIKVAHHKLDDRGDIMSRFRREARICGSLRHPHIGQVFDVGTLEDGAPYMVMELQEGRSLADAVDETALPIAAVIDITRQLLAGLGAVHQAGSIHLDVKPDNVMLVRDHGGDLVVKLVDFGISKRLNEPDPEQSREDDGFIIGSPDYMPPEQLLGERVDTRTDIYATGVLLYETITGRTPFDAETTKLLVDSILRDPIPPVTSLRPDCPPELERIVMRALSRDSDNRYQSADDLSRALAEVRAATRNTAPSNLAKLGEKPVRPGSTTRVRRRRTIDARTLQTLRVRKTMTPKASRRLEWVAGMAVVAMLGIVAFGWWLHVRQRGDGGTATVLTTQAPTTPPPAAPTAAPMPAVQPPPSAAVKIAPAPAVVPTRTAPVAPAPITHVPSPSAPVAVVPQVVAPARVSPKPVHAAAAHVAPEPKHVVVAAPPPRAPEPAPAEQDPQLTRAQLKEAGQDFAHNRDDAALSLYRQLVKAAPSNADAWRGLAATANRMGDRSQAERALRRYLQLRPHSDPTHVLEKPAGIP